MKVLSANPETLTKKEIFNMTKSPEIYKMSDNVDLMIDVSAYVIYEDDDKKEPGKVNRILSIRDTSGKVFATNSATFTNMFEDIVSLMDFDLTEVVIKIIEGTSKAGRTYITCTLI